MGYQDVDLRSISCARIFFDPVNPKRFMECVLSMRVRLRAGAAVAKALHYRQQ